MPLVPQLLDLTIGETRNYSFNFADTIGSAVIDTVVGVTSSCADLTVSDISNDNTNVYFVLADGSTCSRCYITITITTTAGETLIGTGQLRISER